jgi:hypothetical protein
MLQALVSGIQAALGDNLAGVYLRGSLVTGDFDPESSDLDFFAVTERPVSEAEFDRLADLHTRLSALPNRYGDHLEGPYISREAVRRFRPGEVHPTIHRGEQLQRLVHGNNWLLERHVVREQGVTLTGPDPRTLIDPVSAEEIREAVRTRLGDWVEFAEHPEDPHWWQPLGHCAYVVETMCRAAYTLATGELCSKPRAVAWALETFPEPWRSTVERSQVWRSPEMANEPITGPGVIQEVTELVFWAASQAASTASTRED